MPRSLEPITIQEPPLNELKKNHSCIKRTCTTGCGCIVLFLVGSLLLLKMIATPAEKELKPLPDLIKTAIPLYDTESIVKTTLIPARENQKLLNALAIIPKATIGPLFLSLDEYVPDNQQKQSWKAIQGYLEESAVETRDFYTITWQELSANPRFIADHYEKELQKAGFTVEKIAKNHITFSKNNLTGELVIVDADQKDKTDEVVMKIYIDL